MTKHHKAILAKLRFAGKAGVYNSELNEISFRYSARIKELRDGDADGTKHEISVERVGRGLFKFTLVEEELSTADVLEALNPPEVIQPVQMSFLSNETRQKWADLRSRIKPQTRSLGREVVDLAHKISLAKSWLASNPNHPKIVEAWDRFYSLQNQYNELRGINVQL